MRKASRASRHASSAAAAARDQHHTRSILVEGRRGIGERVAVDTLDRRDSLDQQVDPRASSLALMTLLDPSAQHPRVAIRVAEPFELGIELAELVFVPAGHAVGGLVDRGVELLGERERGRTRSVNSGRRAREDGPQVRERTGQRRRPAS